MPNNKNSKLKKSRIIEANIDADILKFCYHNSTFI